MIILLLGLLLMFGTRQSAFSAPIDDLIAAAKKEGVLELLAPSTTGDKGAQALGNAFNKKYGLNIQINYTPSSNMTGDVAKVVMASASRAAPEWDLMLVTDAHHATLWSKGLHQPFDYAKLNVAPELIQYDNGVVGLANQFVLPAYNKNILPPRDVPKRWEDLLDAKWKGGKLGVSTATHHLARLAVGPWGQAKTMEFVSAISKQEPILGTLANLYSRLQVGEILLAVTLTDSFISQAKKDGAPIVFAEGLDPVISPTYNAGVIKGARHPNTGHLFAVFLTLLEAQEIWEKFNGQTSALIPGTTAYKYAQGKRLLQMHQNQAQTVDRLARQYGKILGFER
ncbi:MAG TPA: extracellular solute-binding protein [Terriglobales bacterium]|jgi:iron(III) transport system substrate-binding protein|nr:extracellular solute-binding protein [Terriglobales bacterium]